MHFYIPDPEKLRLDALVPPLTTLLLPEGPPQRRLALAASFTAEELAFGPRPAPEPRPATGPPAT